MYRALTAMAVSSGLVCSLIVVEGLVCVLEMGWQNPTRRALDAGCVTLDNGSEDMVFQSTILYDGGCLCWLRFD